MNITNCIKDLLFSHDCVIIPNFGGFLLNYKSATIHPVTHSFQPPAKVLAFNSNLKVNDGLLANYVSRKSRITYFEALQQINDWVKEIRTKLDNGESITIPEAGTFNYDKEKNLQFSPDTSVNYYADAFGLGSFSSPAIIRQQPQKVAFPVSKEEPTLHTITKTPSRLHTLRRVAAVLIPAAIIATAAIFSILNTDNLNNKISYSGILVSCQRPTSTHTTTVVAEPMDSISNEVVDTEPEVTEEENISTIVPPAPPTNVPPVQQLDNPSRNFSSVFKAPETPEKRYYVIIGSFNTLEAAEQKVRELRNGYFEDSFIVNTSSKNTYRVSAVSYFGFDKAKMQLSMIKEQLKNDAWILHM